ncbi:MAG: hypothetical protein ABIM99_06495 [Candidatus Dojkabacteria bacterium]
MAKSKLNTDLDKSAKKIKKVKPTEEEEIVADPVLTEEPILGEIGDDGYPTEVSPEEDDDTTYTMGEIQVAEGNDSEEVDLKKVPVTEATEEDEDAEWVDEEVSMKDEDPYLDGESFDIDNPYSDDDDNY